MIRLEGSTGVGKSYAMKVLQQQAASAGLRVYYCIEEWLADSTSVEKVLFLDEFNMRQEHLTYFEGLKPGGHRRFFYKGREYRLKDSDKVVFAGNPQSYGGARVEQLLFADGQIPVLHFEDLPPFVIYEQLLKPLWAANGARDEQRFKQEAQSWIRAYLVSHRSEDPYQRQSVRELQQAAIDYLWATGKVVASTAEAKIPPVESGYVELPSFDSVLARLKSFIDQHEAMKAGQFNSFRGGLPACYLEGLPGVGKSALIQHVLSKQGYQIATPGNEGESKRYHVLLASMSFAQMKEIMINAFMRGEFIFLDELNVCLKGELEVLLNSLLSGLNPQTGEPAPVAGFAAFFTGNSLELSDREALSPALHHRVQSMVLPKLAADDMLVLLQAACNDTDTRPSREHLAMLAQCLIDAMDRDPRISLRVIQGRMSELLQLAMPGEKPVSDAVTGTLVPGASDDATPPSQAAVLPTLGVRGK